MADFIILNEELVDKSSACIRIDDRGFLYGDGLFETVRTYNSRAFRLDEHLKRLASSASFLGIQAPVLLERIPKLISDLLKANGQTEARVRITLTRGRHAGLLGLPEASEPTLLIVSDDMPSIPDERYEKGIDLITSDYALHSKDPLARHKTLNYLPYLYAREQARKAGAHEALLLDEHGNVAECATANIFMVQKGCLFTPPRSSPLLPGVTRAAVLEIASENEISIREELFSLMALLAAEEIFITNSVQEALPIRTLDGRVIGDGRPGPVARLLMPAYKGLASSDGPPIQCIK